MSQRDERRSPEAAKYRAWYKTKAWRAIRRAQFAAHPLCQRCRPRGQYVVATVVHHVEAHRGDKAKFFRGPFQSLCKPCHDGDAQSEERLGYSTEIGPDGWPVDAAHPGNR